MSAIKESELKDERNEKQCGDCEDMDQISQLPDELLVKVLSFLPTKVAASTSILSKRWEYLWMWVPKLEYDDRDCSLLECQRLWGFINLNLPLHKASVIESLRLKFRGRSVGSIKPKDIKLWVSVAVSRSVCELRLNLFSFGERPRTKLPSSLYVCKSIVMMKLKGEILVDVPRMVCLPSLKTLFLQRVTYQNKNSLQKLLSKCPVLEDLVVERDQVDRLEKLSVIVQSLQRLTLNMSSPCQLDGLLIDTPSLKSLKVTDQRQESDSDDDIYIDDDLHSDHPRLAYDFQDMPKLEEAEFVVSFQKMDKFLRRITSVKRLSLCLGDYVEQALYSEGIVFNQLQVLTMCSCDSDWTILFARLLKDCPKLRELQIYPIYDHPNRHLDRPNYWEDQLDSVPPYCLLSSLETLTWIGMFALKTEMDVAKYILRNARCLKTATILFHLSCDPEATYEMTEQLSLSFRGSPTCQLVLI